MSSRRQSQPTFWSQLCNHCRSQSTYSDVKRALPPHIAWDAEGPVKAHWTECLRPTALQYLKTNRKYICGSKTWDGKIDCYMVAPVGGKPLSSRPHIVVTCLIERSRKRLIRMLQKDGTIIQSGFEVMGRSGNLLLKAAVGGLLMVGGRPVAWTPAHCLTESGQKKLYSQNYVEKKRKVSKTNNIKTVLTNLTNTQKQRLILCHLRQLDASGATLDPVLEASAGNACSKNTSIAILVIGHSSALNAMRDSYAAVTEESTRSRSITLVLFSGAAIEGVIKRSLGKAGYTVISPRIRSTHCRWRP